MAIQQTRQGFVFQDYIAVEVFLRKYLEGNLKEYYVDYLYDEAAQLSHDIRYITEESGSIVQQCIEVKTGNRFHTENELIGKALHEIYNYLANEESATYELYVSKDFEDNIATCWEALKQLRRGLPLARMSALQHTRMDYLKTLPHLREMTIEDNDMKGFLSRLDIKNPSPEVDFSLSHTKGIEGVISSLIHDIGSTVLSVQLDLPRNPLALPHQLTQELIYITSVFAGSNDDVLPMYRTAIARYFSIAAEPVQPDVPVIEAKRDQYERQLKEFEGLLEVPSQESITDSAEIGVPS